MKRFISTWNRTLENTATDKTGTMKFTLREDGTAQLHVESN